MITLIILTSVTYPIVLGILLTQKMEFTPKFSLFLFSPITLLISIGIAIGLYIESKT